MKSETEGHVLDPESVEQVELDKYDMHAIEEFYPGKLFMWSLFFAALVTPNRKAPT